MIAICAQRKGTFLVPLHPTFKMFSLSVWGQRRWASALAPKFEVSLLLPWTQRHYTSALATSRITTFASNSVQLRVYMASSARCGLTSQRPTQRCHASTLALGSYFFAFKYPTNSNYFTPLLFTPPFPPFPTSSIACPTFPLPSSSPRSWRFWVGSPKRPPLCHL